MPIVGQFGSLAGLGSLVLPGGAMESIATVTVGSGGSASVSLTSIPGTYQHLQLRGIARTERTSTGSVGLRIRFNSDTGNNYAYHRLYGDGSSALATAASSTNRGIISNVPRDGTTASVYCAFVVDILDYASTSKTKTVRSFNGHDLNGSGLVLVDSSLWNSTSAITSLTIEDDGADAQDLKEHTTVALYGIRA